MASLLPAVQNDGMTAPMKSVLLLFLVLRGVPAAASHLFKEAWPLQLSLEADFIRICEANLGGNPDGEDREDKRYWSEAILKDFIHSSKRAYVGRVRARGNSSGRPGEGAFHKLLVEFDKKKSLKETMFKNNRKFRINTHVNTYPTATHTKMGRLNSELGAWREGLAYEIARVMGLPVPQTRRALVTYIEKSTGEQFTRQALLIETDKNFAERLGMTKVSISRFAEQKETYITPADSALVHLFEIFIGNEDFVLRTSQEDFSENGPTWDYGNVIVLQREDGTRTVGPYDFDRSTFVAGEVFLEFSMNAPTTFREQLERMVQRLRTRHPESAFRQAAAQILNKRSEIEKTIHRSLVDEEGRRLALKHLNEFVAYMEEIL